MNNNTNLDQENSDTPSADSIRHAMGWQNKVGQSDKVAGAKNSSPTNMAGDDGMKSAIDSSSQNSAQPKDPQAQQQQEEWQKLIKTATRYGKNAAISAGFGLASYLILSYIYGRYAKQVAMPYLSSGSDVIERYYNKLVEHFKSINEQIDSSSKELSKILGQEENQVENQAYISACRRIIGKFSQKQNGVFGTIADFVFSPWANLITNAKIFMTGGEIDPTQANPVKFLQSHKELSKAIIRNILEQSAIKSHYQDNNNPVLLMANFALEFSIVVGLSTFASLQTAHYREQIYNGIKNWVNVNIFGQEPDKKAMSLEDIVKIIDESIAQEVTETRHQLEDKAKLVLPQNGFAGKELERQSNNNVAAQIS